MFTDSKQNTAALRLGFVRDENINNGKSITCCFPAVIAITGNYIVRYFSCTIV